MEGLALEEPQPRRREPRLELLARQPHRAALVGLVGVAGEQEQRAARPEQRRDRRAGGGGIRLPQALVGLAVEGEVKRATQRVERVAA